MTESTSFDPQWASPPGESVRWFLKDAGIPKSEFAQALGRNEGYLTQLFAGEVVLDDGLADQLSKLVGASKDFWLRREATYRAAAEKVAKISRESEEWANRFPIQDMKQFGWISPEKNIKSKVSHLLSFFGVSSIDEWCSHYEQMMAVVSYRTSKSFDSSPESVASWLRFGEIECANINCDPWNEARLLDTLDHLKSLSRIDNPFEFMPELKSKLASCGVALSIARTPRHCAASGATYWLSDDKAMILMSVRHKTDDHFWFTLFHEIGHLVLHKDQRLILEDGSQDKLEQEANLFSENVLIPPDKKNKFLTLSAGGWRDIIRFAKEVNVSPGIVVGQLQHNDLVKPNHLRKLKKAYGSLVS